MAKRGNGDDKPYKKRISRGKSGKAPRKRREIKIKQIKKKEFIKKMRFITTFLILVVIVAIVIIYSQPFLNENDISNNNHSNGNGDGNIGTELGQTAPDFELDDIDGKGFSLMDYRGSVIILDFMADHCPPCHDEVEHLKEVHLNYSNKDVRIMSIGVDNSESSEQLDNNVREAYGCDWLFAAGGGSVGDAYNVEYIPTIYILDKQGIITYKNVGLTAYSTLSNELDKIV